MMVDVDDMNDIELDMLLRKLAKRAVYLQYITMLVGLLGIIVLSMMLYELAVIGT